MQNILETKQSQTIIKEIKRKEKKGILDLFNPFHQNENLFCQTVKKQLQLP
jgi:hypothetical protein